MQITALYTGSEFCVHKSKCREIPGAGDQGVRELLHLTGTSREQVTQRVRDDSLAAPRRNPGREEIPVTFSHCCAGLPTAETAPAELATAEAVAALSEMARSFRVESRAVQHTCQPLREARTLTVVTVAAPLATTDQAVVLLAALPGVVQLSADGRQIWIYRR